MSTGFFDMYQSFAIASSAATALLLAVTPAFGNAKFIHVPAVLAAEQLPNPPASEDEAAGLPQVALPHVLRLQPLRRVPAAAQPWTIAQPVPADCPPAVNPALVIPADVFYGRRHYIFGGKFHFAKPAWSSRFGD